MPFSSTVLPGRSALTGSPIAMLIGSGASVSPGEAAPQPLSSTMPVRTATFERSECLRGAMPCLSCAQDAERLTPIGATADAAVLTDSCQRIRQHARPGLNEIWVISTPVAVAQGWRHAATTSMVSWEYAEEPRVGRRRAACRNRTDDLLITSEMLYRLS